MGRPSGSRNRVTISSHVSPQTDGAESNVTDETRREFYRRALDAKRDLEGKEEEAKSLRGIYRAVLKEAKKAGVDQKAIADVLAIRHQDPDEILLRERERMRMLALSIMPTIQDDLFGGAPIYEATANENADMEASRAFDAGHFAGSDGEKREANPHRIGSDLWDTWDRAWLMGQTRIANTLQAKETAYA